ncbi:hypothetical protein C5E07_06875 [Pseudoclavibacter sp. RFBJ3]|uniref:hypothetical protein n=1 Tax=unclassified Pseudoclavibacter TaxID=2615177 RepID=UPI000CE786A6|nr:MULTISPECIES: hypothetical protein [unclassified Pseudoclavibacter]PPF85392.1 hypothetical protein C5C12_03900 [Pseudoclavibacter sp. RFBJ5]PPF93214.1 hypothetical protein C5E07_06875 [Pseudoclavibacter sp. RFBJ3]PPF99234.1 hypothetical protein C5C19_06155 [Pseudoclavibacter sp. RFBH5]PPG25513.1 hypothetical protein C5E13_03215 [Pseudoclavibacter sp. RFBI4]
MALPIRLRTRATASVVLATSLLALLSFVAPTAAQADTTQPPAWSIDTVDGDRGSGRPNFTYDVNPGDVIADSMTVTNTGPGALELTIYAADAFTTATGAVDILENGEPSVDAGTWVAPGAGSVSLEPGASIDVPFTLTVPADATPGDHSAAIVASLLPADSTDQVKVERRLGLRIDMRVSGELAPTAEIRSLATDWGAAGVNPFGGGTTTVSYELVNTGNVRLSSLEDLRLSGIGGAAGVAMTGGEIPELLPGSAVTITREITTGAIGPLTGALTVYLQPVGAFTDVPVAVTADLSAFALPWSLVILGVLLLVAAAGIVFWFWFWRRRRLDLLMAGYDSEAAPGAERLAPPRTGGQAGGAALAVIAGIALALATGIWSPTPAVAEPAPTAPSGIVEVTIPAPTVAPTPTGTSASTAAPTTVPSAGQSIAPTLSPGASTGTGPGTGSAGGGAGLASTGTETLAIALGVGTLALTAGIILLLRRRGRAG